MPTLIYCPVCGHTLSEREEAGRPRQVCDNCGYIHYVNPVPAVGILIEAEGGLVLIRRSNPPHRDSWALPSGYVEADESAEEAAIREAREETGLNVELIELAGVNSFPEGPPLSGIMIFYRARAVGGVLSGGDDAAEARVFQAEDLPLLPFRTHREAVAQWLEKRGSPHVLPSGPSETPAEDFDIRPAQPNDANEVVALLALIPANRSIERDAWRDILARFREPAGIEIFVAVARQNPPIVIGFVALSVIRTLTEGRGLINDMAVLPAYQRRGVGAALLEAAMRECERRNLRLLLINEQRANDRARAFYAALGFDEIGFMQLKLR